MQQERDILGIFQFAACVHSISGLYLAFVSHMAMIFHFIAPFKRQSSAWRHRFDEAAYPARYSRSRD